MSDLVGVGIDVVDVDRLAGAIGRRPGLAARIFTDAERTPAPSVARTRQRLAARFAAKEAAMKALGVGLGAFRLRDVEIVTAPNGRPTVALHGAAKALASSLGVTAMQVSLTHTASIASAIVVAERAS
ncbi:MAG TPA: holo-ACP synthase [Acidimicrobiales bacterium]